MTFNEVSGHTSFNTKLILCSCYHSRTKLYLKVYSHYLTGVDYKTTWYVDQPNKITHSVDQPDGAQQSM